MGRKELGKERTPGGEVPKTEGPLHVVFTPKEEWYWVGHYLVPVAEPSETSVVA